MKDTFTFYWDEFTLHDSSEPNQMWPNSDKCIQNEELATLISNDDVD